MHNCSETEYIACQHVMDGATPVRTTTGWCKTHQRVETVEIGDEWLICSVCIQKDASNYNDLKSKDLVHLCAHCARPILSKLSTKVN
jgi:hypothetical protein